MSRRQSLAFAAAATIFTSSTFALATPEMLFGFGPRSTSLGQADIADAEASSSAYTNPAFAAKKGVRLSLGYGHGFTRLTLNDQKAPIRDIAGTDLTVQAGGSLSDSMVVGGAFALHLPNRSLARIAFYPGTEPQFVRYEPAAQRTTADLAIALRVGAISVGLGTAMIVDARGDGVDFVLGQDGNGTYADSKADLSFPYRFAPIAGLNLDLGKLSVGARFRGAQSVDLGLETRADVRVEGNPLNGKTTVGLKGSNGYVPATLDLGVRITPISWAKAMISLQYARWRDAPSPVADVTMNIGLGLSPGELQGRFTSPRFRDTLSPRLGVELLPQGPDGLLRIRAGYLYSPSPVPKQPGFTSLADASFHAFSTGLGFDFGSVWGVHLQSNLATQLAILSTRNFNKSSDVLPFASYEVAGRIFHVSASVEGAWE